MANKVLPRNKIDKKFTWNAESVFPSIAEWEKEAEKIVEDISKVKQYQGRLAESADVLLEAMNASEQLILRAYKLYMYASFSYAVETTNQQVGGLLGKAQGIFGQVASAVAYLQPETLEIGKDKLDQWMSHPSGEKLAVYRQNFEDLFRQQAHVRSAEVEEILGLVSDPLGGAYNSTSMLTNADFKFKSVKDSKGQIIDVTQGNYDTQLMHLPDRKARRAAYETYMDRYVEHKNTLASNLETSIKANVFNMRARKHETTLSASLFNLNIPTDVFHNLINTFKKNLPVWHRYF
ncbi:MAG TPA: M3 family metallopeptidase, partial [Anaerolineales bacterium]|nr:M3 family metallopeptidase [Anaerolineales bacterium]